MNHAHNTLKYYVDVVTTLAGRGIIIESLGALTIVVPKWAVNRVDESIKYCMPVGVKLEVRSMTLCQHLFFWKVKIVL